MKKRQRASGPRSSPSSTSRARSSQAIRAELPEDGIFVDEVTQVGFAARLLLPVYKPRTFLSPGYQDNLGWGYATALGAQDARRDVPVLSINGDGGFMYTANELATAVRHRIPLVAIVFADGSFGNVRRIQEENYGNRLIASDLANPDFVKFAESFGAAGERVRTPEELREALRRGFARRDGPTLIEMPVGPMPSPWEFILMGESAGRVAEPARARRSSGDRVQTDPDFAPLNPATRPMQRDAGDDQHDAGDFDRSGTGAAPTRSATAVAGSSDSISAKVARGSRAIASWSQM